MRHTTLVFIGLMGLVGAFSLSGCMAGKGLSPAGGGLNFGGGGASPTSPAGAEKTDEGTPADAGAGGASAPEPAVASSGPLPSGVVPAFGPDAKPPMSDSDAVGHGDLFAKTSAPPPEPAAKTVETLPEAEDFRLIAGFQPYSVQEPDQKLPAFLTVFPRVNEHVGALKAPPLLIQTLGDTKPDGTKGAYWWDIIRGPTVRLVLQRNGQDPADAKFVDIPVGYSGMKETGRGDNLNVDLSYDFWAGDTVSFYLYYDTIPSAASATDYFKKPDGFNSTPKSPVKFASPEAARQFFDDKHVHFLGSFPISLDAGLRAPEPEEPKTASKDRPQYTIAPNLERPSLKDLLAVAFKPVFYTEIDYISPSGAKPLPGMDIGNVATIDISPDDKAALDNLGFNVRYASLEDCAGAECWTWQPVDDGRYVRMYVQRQVGYDSFRYAQDFKIAAIPGQAANLSLQNVPLKDGDILDFYYSRSGRPSTYAADFMEMKRSETTGGYEDPFFSKALFMGQFQVRISSKIRYDRASPAIDFKPPAVFE